MIAFRVQDEVGGDWKGLGRRILKTIARCKFLDVGLLRQADSACLSVPVDCNSKQPAGFTLILDTKARVQTLLEGSNPLLIRRGNEGVIHVDGQDSTFAILVERVETWITGTLHKTLFNEIGVEKKIPVARSLGQTVEALLKLEDHLFSSSIVRGGELQAGITEVNFVQVLGKIVCCWGFDEYVLRDGGKQKGSINICRVEMPSLCGSNPNNRADTGLTSDRTVETIRIIIKAWATGKALNHKTGFESCDFAMFTFDFEDPFGANWGAACGERSFFPRAILTQRGEF